MTRQELVEQNLRMLIGDLNVQLIMANATMIELREELERANAPKNTVFEDVHRVRPNGPIEASIP
jgi:hypothetical protein